MDKCLNILDRPEVFIPVAALIVIVLLVWAQLSARGKTEDLYKDVNLVLGFVWTYFAIFIALIAVAVFILTNGSLDGINPWPKFLLVLSFLMTMANVIVSFGLTLYRLLGKDSFIRSPTEGLNEEEKHSVKRDFTIYWISVLVGLVLVSLSVVRVVGAVDLSKCFLWVGIGLCLTFFIIMRGIISRIKKENNNSPV